MKHRLALLALLALLSPGLAVPVSAQDTTEPPVLLEENFDGATMPPEIVLSHGGEIVPKGDVALPPGAATAEIDSKDQVVHLALRDSPAGRDFLYIRQEWRNYALEVDLYVVAGPVSLLIRDQTGTAITCGYSLEIKPESRVLNLRAQIGADCAAWKALARHGYSFPTGQWVTVRFEAVGPKLTVLVDGAVVFTAEDDTYAFGEAGVFAWPGSDVYVDNLKVYDLGAGDEADAEPPAAPQGLPKFLDAYAGPYNEAIAELQSQGAIPAGGALVFVEDYAYFTGAGDFFTPLARTRPATDIVMAGELTFQIGDESEYELCGLMHRVYTDASGTATSFIEVGVDTNGDVYIFDLKPDGEDRFNLRPLRMSLDTPHHFLVITGGEETSVYVDGRLVIDGFSVVSRAGAYGIDLRGKGAKARCEGRNIWVYEIDLSAEVAEPASPPNSAEEPADTQPGAGAGGVCSVTGDGVNRRGGPGTNYPVQGQLSGAETANGQAAGADGYVWWRLSNDTWVRSDVVGESGDCANLPTVAAPPPPAAGGTAGGTSGSTGAALTGGGGSIVNAARAARSHMQQIASQIDIALGGVGGVDCGAIARHYEAAVAAPTFSVSGNLQGPYGAYRAGITTFQNGVSDLYNGCVSSIPEIPYHAWSGARAAINDAISQLEAAISALGG